MMGISVQSVSVLTTSNRTRTADEISHLAIDKIIGIADTAPPVIKEQTIAYKEQVRKLIAHYIQSAVLEERNSCAAAVENISKESAFLIRSKN